MSDLIDRQMAIDALGDEGLITAMCVIARLPTAQPKLLTNVIESKYMQLYEVWNRLDSLSNYIRSMIEEHGDNWSKDFISCRIAMAVIDRYMDEHPEAL